MKNRCIIAFLILLVFIAEGQEKRDESQVKLLQAAREIINASGTCALITVDQNGIAHARTMDPFEPEDDFTIWLATNPKSRKVNELTNNPNVTLYYNDPKNNGYVTLYGKAFLVNDQVEKDTRWKEEWKAYYPNRNDSYLLIKVLPSRLEVINYVRGINGNEDTWQPAFVLFDRK